MWRKGREHQKRKKERSKMQVYREKIYFYNLDLDSKKGEYSCGIKMNIRSLCIKFINKAQILSSCM